MKIAVIGLYYASNLGDAVICDSVEYLLKKEYPSAEIDVIDIEGNQAFAQQQSTSFRLLWRRKWNLKRDCWLTKHHIDDRIYYWNQIDVENKLEFYAEVAERKYDVAVFAGGQLFMDWLALDLCGFLKCFAESGTPVIFNACGAGFSISDAIRKTMAEHLKSSNIKLISTRDDAKKIEKMYELESGETVRTYDPALWAQEVYGVRAKPSGVVGLGVMYSTHAGFHKIARFWMKVIRELDARNIKWKMFCNGSIDDYNFGRYVLEKMGLDVEKNLCAYPETPKELIEQIASFDSLISFRLHSHIIAASLGIPAAALVWDEKLRFFYKNIGHGERCLEVTDSAVHVLNVWEQACKEGYDTELIREQKQFAAQLLTEAVQKEVCGE